MSAPKDLTGQRFGRLVAQHPIRENGKTKWACKCDCGSVCLVSLSNLESGQTKSCGCLRKSEIKSGMRFGRLMTVCPTEKRSYGRILWECLCDCGNKCFVTAYDLTHGTTKSCGCYRREKLKKHGKEPKKLYGVWNGIKQRCNNPKRELFNRYGGRGIHVCGEWSESFEAFRDWSLANGYAEGKEIHRIDNDGDYSPENCEWLTVAEHKKRHHPKSEE